MKRKHHNLTHGFTLIELASSMAVTAVLLLAIGSAMMISGKALPTSATAASSIITAANDSNQIASELRFAIHFTERTSKSVTFTIPDRDGDGKPEIIRYAWSGVAGAPVTRQLNGATATKAVASAEHFELTYDTSARVDTYPGPFTDQAEQLLAGYMPTSGFTSGEVQIKDDDWYGQYFQPTTMPANAQSWRVTRARFMNKKDSTIQNIGVMFYNVDGNKKPTGSVIEQVNIAESSSSSSYIALEASFSNVSGRTPGTGLCLLTKNTVGSSTVAGRSQYAQNSGGGGLVRVQFQSALLGLLTDIDVTAYPTHTLLHEIYGKVNLSTFSESRTRTTITAVGIALQTSTDASSRIDSRVALANQPEALGAYWSVNFDRGPTLLDENGDGQADWRTTGGFDNATLASGVWSADRVIDTNPGYNFNGFTTVEAKLEDATTTGNGACVELRVKPNSSSYGSIDFTLAKQSNGTQTLTLRTRELVAVPQTLLTINGLAAGTTTVRLDLKPASELVSLTVNGLAYGQFTYKRTVAVSEGVVRAYPMTGEAGAKFDSLTVRTVD